MIPLYMLFVDFSSFFSMQSLQVWKRFELTDPVESIWFQQKTQKRRRTIADCTQYLYINMCMIHASFEIVTVYFHYGTN